MRTGKVVLSATAGLATLVVLVLAVGFTLPERHRATVRAQYRAPADVVYRTIIDVAAAPTWRTGVDSVQILSEQPLTWREHSGGGTLTMEMVEASSTRVVSRIADTSQGFGGTWIFEVVPDAEGTTLTITEDGEVYNPLFRVMSRFVFGHYSGLERYAADLGTKFGENVQAVRVESLP
ncbi:MAG TPA: SRPBCC family protein [Longimicrobiales bacterium]|nr:SRPBCC family protein [Longimicrobiales bacterium]